MKASLPVIRNLGGCGSTLVGRLLAALPNVVLLSECNPRSAYLFGGCMNPINQLRGWFPELLPVVDGIDEYELGDPFNFGYLINKLDEHLRRESKQLVIRDYSYVDFVGYPFLYPVPRVSSLSLALDINYNVKDVILVRHPTDQLASLRDHYCMRNLNAGDFVYSYIQFLCSHRNVPIFRYEDIVNNTSEQMKVLCDFLGIRWDDQAIANFVSVDKITGNLDRINDGSISKPARRNSSVWAEEDLKKVNNYKQLLEMIGYES